MTALRLAPVAAAALALVAAPAAEAQLARLAFATSSGGGRIDTMQADGSQRGRAVPVGRAGGSPAWSPDGRRLAYVRSSGGDRRDQRFSIWISSPSGQRQLTGGPGDGSPAWTPDGATVGFVRTEPARGDGPPATSIFTVNAEGGDPAPLRRGGGGILYGDPAYSPDGTRLAYTRVTLGEAGFATAIHVLDLVSGADRRLTEPASQPDWSPDGTRLAFVTARDRSGETCFHECSANHELYVMDADGGAQTRITRTTADESAPAWSPDGRWIAFGSDLNYPTQNEIHVVDPSGSCRTWLTNGNATSGAPDWDPTSGPDADPGACTMTPRPPLLEFSLAGPRRVRGLSVHWLGPDHRDMLLSSVEPRMLVYDDCSQATPARCAGEIQLQHTTTCRRHPLAYSGGPPGSGLADIVIPRHRFLQRGALVAYYPSAGGWDVYTGRTTVTVFGPPRLAIRRLVRALRPVLGPARRRLAAPRFPAAMFRALERVRRVHSRLGSVDATARRLRITPRAVRDRLALRRLVDRRRALRC